MALQVYTASLLKEGFVAYLCLEGGNAYWSTDLNKAAAVDESSIDDLKQQAERSEAENIVVGAYAVDVIKSENGLVPASKREQIRAGGPTFRLPADASATGTASEGLHAA